ALGADHGFVGKSSRPIKSDWRESASARRANFICAIDPKEASVPLPPSFNWQRGLIPETNNLTATRARVHLDRNGDAAIWFEGTVRVCSPRLLHFCWNDTFGINGTAIPKANTPRVMMKATERSSLDEYRTTGTNEEYPMDGALSFTRRGFTGEGEFRYR